MKKVVKKSNNFVSTNSKIRFTIAILNISVVLYTVLGFIYAILRYFGLSASVNSSSTDYIIWISIILFFLAFITVIMFVIGGLRKNKVWAWVAALVFSILYTFSLFLPLGLVGLYGLLHKDTRRSFFKAQN